VPPSAPSGPGTADGSAGRAGGSVATGAVVPDDKRTPQDAASDAVAVTAQPKGLAPGRLDGRWIGHLACGRYEDIPAGSRKIPFSVVGGHFVLEWGPQGNPGFGHVEGSPSADGTLTLRGTVIAKNARNLGKTVGARFDGNPTAQGFDMRGQIGRERSCSLSLVRSQ